MGLTQKILLFTSLMIVALVGTTLAYTTVQADHLAHQTITQALAETRGVWEAYEADRYAKLKLGLRTLANDRGFTVLLEEHADDAESIADTLQERSADVAADLFLATDTRGHVLARAKHPEAAGQDLSKDPLVTRTLEGEDSVTLWRQGNSLFHAVAVPLAVGDTINGVLAAGYEINKALADQMRRLTQCEIAFVTRPPDQPAQLAVSSLGPREAALGQQLAGALADVGSGKPFELDLSGERFIAIQAPLKDASGKVQGSVVALRSLQKEMAGFTQFRNSLIVVSLVVMAVGLALAYLVSTRITGPVRTLVRMVERAKDGSYSGAVAVGTHDEIGVLARSFNNLLAELREKEQLIGYLREGMTELRRGGAGAQTQVSSAETSQIAAISAQAGVAVEKGQLFAGRYEILSTVGRGGMGIVYRALDKRLDEEVALKVLRPEILKEDPTLLKRFKEELRLARKITHRNVLRTHDLDVTPEGTPYISMEYLEGVTLKDLVVGKGALPLGVGLRVCKQMCAGLDAAHRVGVVHRDIKPQNMLILPETGELKIMDFGIARRQEVQPEGGLTTDGMVMGTPDYMAPEQAQGQPTDFRSDVYALGVVFFEVFTGKLPFHGETLMATVLKHIQEPPPDPRGLNPKLPAELGAAVLRCLAKEPGRRYAKVVDILKDLNAISARVDQSAAA